MEEPLRHSFRLDMHKEAIVKTNTGTTQSAVLLRRGGLMKIQARPGTRVTCTRGMVWLTQENDPLDRIVCAGETFVVDRPGAVLVNALASYAVLEYPDGEGSIVVRPPASEGASTLSLDAEIARIRSRVDPEVLRAMPAADRREIVEREAHRMRSQVAWLVLQHMKNGLAAIFAGALARAGRRLVAAARAAANRTGRSSGERGVGRNLTAPRSAADGRC